MGVIQSAEPRTFEQRFGKVCPFCGATWGSPTPCDPEPKMTWKDTNRALFEKPVFPERKCLICEESFRPSEPSRNTCSVECRTIHRRRMGNERSKRYKRRKRAEARDN